jgi:hypothetical protein
MQKGIVVFVFSNYLDNVLVWNYAMSGFKRGMQTAGMGFIPACIHFSISLKFIELYTNLVFLVGIWLVFLGI